MMEIFNLLFVVLLCSSFVRQTNGEAFSLRTMNAIKGMAILGVFVGHASKEFLGVALYKLLCPIGACSVAVFFFVSGYGLMYGTLYKKDYRNGFIGKRVLPIVGCYLIVCVLKWLTDGCVGWSWSKVALCDYIPFAWYIFSILWLYVMFYFALLVCVKPIGIIGTVVGLLGAYMAVCFALWGTLKGGIAMATFVIGCLFAYYNSKFPIRMGGGNWMILSVLFCTMYAIGLTNKYVHYPQRLLSLYEPVVSYSFPLVVFGWMQWFTVRRFELIWGFLQQHSLQIYLIHGLVMYKMMAWVNCPSEVLPFVIFGITVVGAVIIRRLTNVLLSWRLLIKEGEKVIR